MKRIVHGVHICRFCSVFEYAKNVQYSRSYSDCISYNANDLPNCLYESKPVNAYILIV